MAASRWDNHDNIRHDMNVTGEAFHEWSAKIRKLIGKPDFSDHGENVSGLLSALHAAAAWLAMGIGVREHARQHGLTEPNEESEKLFADGQARLWKALTMMSAKEMQAFGVDVLDTENIAKDN